MLELTELTPVPTLILEGLPLGLVQSEHAPIDERFFGPEPARQFRKYHNGTRCTGLERPHTIRKSAAATATRVIRSISSSMTQTRRSGASVSTVATKSLNGPATILT